MKRFLPFSLLSVLLFLSSARGETPVCKITLPRGALSTPIGVEPEGGHFEKLLEANAKPGDRQGTVFNTYLRRQNESTLAIYGIESDTIHEEKPLARVTIIGLREGARENRVRVRLTAVSSREVLVEAWDLPSDKPLVVVPFAPEQAIASAKRKTAPDRTLPPIGSLDTHVNRVPPPPDSAQTIGIRSAGGLFLPLVKFPAGTAPGTTKEFFVRPRFNDQTTADMTFFTGHSSFIEGNSVWGRYLVSGMPLGDEKRRIKFVLTAGRDGKADQIQAFDATSKQPLALHKYSDFAAERISEKPRTDVAAIPRHIPALPGTGR